MIERLRARLGDATDVSALVAFRVALGVLVTVSAVRFLAYGWVTELFVKPTFFFSYLGFGWVKPLPGSGMHVVFGAVAALGLLFAAGAFYRVVAPLLFVLFAYIQLCDVTNWLNHYYLVSLLLLLCSVMPLGRAWSVDAFRRPAARLASFPAWCTHLLRFQVAVVYVFAGLAKLSSDWLLHAQPLNIWLSARSGLPFVGSLFEERAVAFAFAWGGFLFDTTIAAFLLWRRTRPYAYVVVLGFHAVVGWLFPIGMFPWIMVTAVLAFFAPAWPRDLLARLRLSRVAAFLDRGELAPPERAALRPLGRLLPALAVAYCILQVALPLRHRLYGGNVLWHEQGMRFSWKVMVREKNGSITYAVHSPKANRTWYVAPRRYLTDRQERELAGQPDLLLQLAHHIQDDFRQMGHDDVEVRVESLVSLNGRSATALVDPKVDLARIQDGLGRAAWITPEPTSDPIHLRPLHRGGPAPLTPRRALSWSAAPSSSPSGS